MNEKFRTSGTSGIVQLVIENCEPALSQWLRLEYKHACEIWDGDVIFTNVNDPTMLNALAAMGTVRSEAAPMVCQDKRCAVLDPQAGISLKTEDFYRLDCLIVGGILGAENPLGRTKQLITDRMHCESRNIGKAQLSIDGAAFVAKAIMLGMRLDEIEIASEVEIVHDDGHSTILPFGYPIVDGKVILTPGLVEYLSE